MAMVIMLLSAFLEKLPVWSFQRLGSESKRDPCLQLIVGEDLDFSDGQKHKSCGPFVL